MGDQAPENHKDTSQSQVGSLETSLPHSKTRERLHKARDGFCWVDKLLHHLALWVSAAHPEDEFPASRKGMGSDALC